MSKLNDLIKQHCPDLPAVYLSDRQGRQAAWNIRR